jgi:hypothetical protein
MVARVQLSNGTPRPDWPCRAFSTETVPDAIADRNRKRPVAPDFGNFRETVRLAQRARTRRVRFGHPDALNAAIFASLFDGADGCRYIGPERLFADGG